MIKINNYFIVFLFFVLLTNPVALIAQETDEFEEFIPYEADADSGEFEEFEEFSETSSGCGNCSEATHAKNNLSLDASKSEFWWVIGILITTIAAGFLVRYKTTRNLRGLFLVVSLLVLGFYRGGCPCPIMSLHHTLFAIFGIHINLLGMLWFLGLLVITYFLGKVWCGWICHLGALQEFIFIPGRFKFLQTAKAQLIMRITRVVLFIALAIQIASTQTNIFKSIDPFKVAFNFMASHWIGWILLGLLLLSSVFIYRPFCKTICPIGLILGWVSKIPGAAVIGTNKQCSSCKICNSSCQINAITRDQHHSVIDNQECILCGDCISDCKKGSLSFKRKSKSNPSIHVLKG